MLRLSAWWDGNGNGLYNEAGTQEDPNPDNVSRYPDLAVARLPAASMADVDAYVSKVITYETTPRGREFTFVHDADYGWFQWTSDLASQVDEFAVRTLVIDRVFKTFAPNPLAMAPSGWVDATGQDVAHAASLSNWVPTSGTVGTPSGICALSERCADNIHHCSAAGRGRPAAGYFTKRTA